MKIAILHDNFPPHSVGGADIVAFQLAKKMQARGHEVLVITTVRNKNEEGAYTHEGLHVHAIATGHHVRFRAYVSLWNVPAVRKVKKLLEEFNPAVVHAHNVHGYLSYGSLAVARRLGAKVILTCHDVMAFNYQKFTDFIDPHNLSVPSAFNYRVSAWRQFKKNRFRYNPFRNVIIRYILRNFVDKIVAVSDALKEALLQNGIGNITVVHNGIDVAEWQTPEDVIAAFKQKYGLGESVVLFGGRLSAVKGGGKLLEALSLVVKSVPKLQLLVIGKEDGYASTMASEAQKMGLEGRIRFTGWVVGQQLHAAYHAATVAVFPSLCFDTFGLVNIEAMACRKPVIATCFGGSPEIVEDKKTGYIINPYNVPLLAEKISDLLIHTDTAETFGEAGYRRVQEHFSLTQQAAHYEGIFSATIPDA